MKIMSFPISYNSSSTLYHGYKGKEIVRLLKGEEKNDKTTFIEIKLIQNT